jgi:hypothetical protein
MPVDLYKTLCVPGGSIRMSSREQTRYAPAQYRQRLSNGHRTHKLTSLSAVRACWHFSSYIYWWRHVREDVLKRSTHEGSFKWIACASNWGSRRTLSTWSKAVIINPVIYFLLISCLIMVRMTRNEVQTIVYKVGRFSGPVSTAIRLKMFFKIRPTCSQSSCINETKAVRMVLYSTIGTADLGGPCYICGWYQDCVLLTSLSTSSAVTIQNSNDDSGNWGHFEVFSM